MPNEKEEHALAMISIVSVLNPERTAPLMTKLEMPDAYDRLRKVDRCRLIAKIATYSEDFEPDEHLLLVVAALFWMSRTMEPPEMRDTLRRLHSTSEAEDFLTRVRAKAP